MVLALKLEFNEAMIAQLQKIPLMLRLGPAERVLKAMAKPILVKGKAIAPSSRKPGKDGIPSGQKRSKKAVAKFGQSDARNNLGVVYRKNDGGGYLVIGGKSPAANTFNFDSSDEGRRVVYWGKLWLITKKRIPPKERFMQRAADETLPAQITAGEAQLRKELQELKLG